jgi:alcohol dehydrogenase
MTQARALVFDQVGSPLRMQSFPLPALLEGEALAQVELCTLCGSDLHSLHGRRPTPTPTILGHEILGRIVEFAARGEPPSDAEGKLLTPGERVVWMLAVGCGQCGRCQGGLPQKCLRLFKYGHEAIRPEIALSGGLATHVHLRAGTAVFRVPADLPDVVACPASCATATVMAAYRQAGEVAHKTVLVQGAGMLGLTAAAVAQSRGARHIVVSDPVPQRLELAKRFGATHLLPAAQNAVEAARLFQSVVGIEGADIALEMSGAAEAIETGIGVLNLSGRSVWVGSVFPGRPAQVDAETVVRRLLTITGVHNYIPQDLRDALAFLQAPHTRYPFAELVQPIFPLSEVPAALTHFPQGKAARVGVRPDTAG